MGNYEQGGDSPEHIFGLLNVARKVGDGKAAMGGIAGTDFAKGGRVGYFFGGRVNYKSGGRVSFKNGGLAGLL